jgi:uncharacterized protein
MKIGIIGGSGFIGSFLANAIVEKGDSVVIFSRKSTLPPPLRNKPGITLTTAQIPLIEDLEKLDVLINLAGESIIGERWSEKRKAELHFSRIEVSNALFKNLQQAKKLPLTYLGGSAIGFYGAYDDGTNSFTEDSPPGSDFLSKLSIDWENANSQIESLGIRTIYLRTGVVLSPHGGALAQMLLPFKAFVGGVISPGTQMMSWIHIVDAVQSILHLVYNDENKGIFNIVSPNPTSNEEFSNLLAESLNRPCLFKIPKFTLELMYGEGACVVLKGQKVLPKRLLESSYKFQYPDLKLALNDLLKSE